MGTHTLGTPGPHIHMKMGTLVPIIIEHGVELRVDMALCTVEKNLISSKTHKKDAYYDSRH